MSKTAHSLLIAALSAPVAVHGASVYVAPPPLSESAAAVLESEVSVRNVSAVQQKIVSRERDSASGRLRSSRVAVAAGATSVLRAPALSSAVLELSGEADLLYEARLTSGGEAVVDLPVITDETSFEGGQTLSLQGLFASESTATNVALVNLARSRNRCSIALATPDGAGMGAVRSLTLKGLESRAFLDVFESLLTEFGTTEARASVTCAEAFYAFALLDDEARGSMEMVAPLEAEASLVLPDTVLPECPPKADCYDVPGLAFVPEPPPGLPVGRVWWPARPGATTRLWLSMDVKISDWFVDEPSGKHLVYWFVINANPDLAGLVYFRGPGKEQVFAIQGLRVKHGGKKRIIESFAAQAGHTYNITNDYNLAGKTYTVRITDLDTGEVVKVLQGKPNVAAFVVKQRSAFVVDMGFFPGTVEHEVPSYGWEYSNIHVEAFMK